MNIQQRVIESSLPLKQELVIKSILKDIEEVAFLSGSEICDKYSTSLSSLTRISQAIGFNGFSDFKKEIEIEYKRSKSLSLQLDNFFDSVEESNSIFSTTLEHEIRNINNLKESVDSRMFEDISTKIVNANRIFCAGVGQVEIIASKLSTNLSLIGIKTFNLLSFGLSKEIVIHAPNKKDILIVFSINKELSELKELIEYAKKNGVQVIVFGDLKTGHLKSISDYYFYSPSSGISFYNSLCSMIMLTNILESYVISLNKHANRLKIRKTETHLEKLPIFLN